MQYLVLRFLFIKLMIMICWRQLCLLWWRFPTLFTKEHVPRFERKIWWNQVFKFWALDRSVWPWQAKSSNKIKMHLCWGQEHIGAVFPWSCWDCGIVVMRSDLGYGALDPTHVVQCSFPCMHILHTSPAQVEHSSLLMWTSEKNKALSKASASDLIDTHTGFIGLWPCVCGLGEVWSTWFTD